MAVSKLVLPFFLSSLLLLSPIATAQNAKFFTEYIGALYNGVQFTNVPINPNVDFHFILAFVIDYDSSSVATNGQFNIYWQNSVLTASAIASIKASNPNVKIGLSLGGDTINGNPVVFSATSVSAWVANAVSSLTSIIQEYHIDGIDIDYEHFSTGDTDTFAQCIGQLITTLKNNRVISFASIAPFDNSDVQTRYQALWAQYSSVIDYVNFQFYAYASGTTVDQFLSYYNTQLSNYNGGKVLVSFTTGGSGGLSPANGFFDACSTLQSENKLYGIFVWSADSSYANGNFQYETQAQQLLANA